MKTSDINKNAIFDVASIHQHYWKDFCDVCYSRFGFEHGEVRTYKQKYETFCRCKNYVTSEEGYERQLLMAREEDLKSLKACHEWLYTVNDAQYLVPASYAFCRLADTVGCGLFHDVQLIKYICPRKPEIRYKDFLLDAKKSFAPCMRNNNNISDFLKKGGDDEYILKWLLPEGLADNIGITTSYSEEDPCGKCEITEDGPLTDYLQPSLETVALIFNERLEELMESLPEGMECPRGGELQAFVFRLFMSYECSLKDIKDTLDEYPVKKNLEHLATERDKLIKEFETTDLGKHWCNCIGLKDGLLCMARYFMHHRSKFDDKAEQEFFYVLDKIGIINDILDGHADKYWLTVNYPEGWNQNTYVPEDDNNSLVLELSSIFHGNTEEVRSFLRDISGKKPTLVVRKVNELVRTGKIGKEFKGRPLWKALHDAGLYIPTETNWNNQIK